MGAHLEALAMGGGLGGLAAMGAGMMGGMPGGMMMPPGMMPGGMMPGGMPGGMGGGMPEGMGGGNMDRNMLPGLVYSQMAAAAAMARVQAAMAEEEEEEQVEEKKAEEPAAFDIDELRRRAQRAAEQASAAAAQPPAETAAAAALRAALQAKQSPSSQGGGLLPRPPPEEDTQPEFGIPRAFQVRKAPATPAPPAAAPAGVPAEASAPHQGVAAAVVPVTAVQAPPGPAGQVMQKAFNPFDMPEVPDARLAGAGAAARLLAAGGGGPPGLAATSPAASPPSTQAAGPAAAVSVEGSSAAGSIAGPCHATTAATTSAEGENEPETMREPKKKQPAEALAEILAAGSRAAGGAASSEAPTPSPVNAAAAASASTKDEGVGRPKMVEVPPPEEKKKDASSVASFLQKVQSNVARGRTDSVKQASDPAVQQVFLQTDLAKSGSGGASGPAASTGPSSRSLIESLIERFEESSNAEQRRGLEQEMLRALAKLEPPRAAELVVRVHAVDGMRSAEFLDDLCSTLSPIVAKFGSPHLTRILGTMAAWALITSGTDESGTMKLSSDVRAFFGSASTELSLRFMDVVPGDLSRIATTLASVSIVEPRLFASLARAAVARTERFTAQELVALACAFDKAKLMHTGLFEGLARCLRTNVHEVSPKDLLKGMRVLAMCGIRDKELGQAICDELSKFQEGLAAEEFCALAWACCALDLCQEKLFRAVFRALEDSALISGETLCQLYEIHVTLKTFHQSAYKAYELEDDMVQSLRDHYKKHRGGKKGGDVKIERSSEKIHEDVAEALRDVVDGSVQKQYQTGLGFSVDVAVTRRRSSAAVIFVEIDGPQSLVRSLDPLDPSQVGRPSRVRGAVLLKRRVLQMHGFRQAVITEDAWGMLNNREKKDLLHEILKTAGVSKDRML